MGHFETRCKINNIIDARSKAEKIGGIFRGFYKSTDYILDIQENGQYEGILTLRVYTINNRETKDYQFIHKVSEWSEKIKKDRIFLKEEFDTIEKAVDFIIAHYGDFHEDFEYHRDGWEYSLNKSSIFIENIEKLGPTIEIESDSKGDLENLLKIFEVGECFSKSTSEIMRKLML